MSLCRKHNIEYHDSPVGECPVCVRDERDELARLVTDLERKRDQLSLALAVVEMQRDQAVRDAEGAAELADALHRVQQERDRLQQIASENAAQCRTWSEQHGKRMDQIGALEKERDRLRGQLDEASRLLDEVMSWHKDKNSPDYNECDKAECFWCEQAGKVVNAES